MLHIRSLELIHLITRNVCSLIHTFPSLAPPLSHPWVSTVLASVFMSLTALEMIGWQFQDQVFKRLYLPSVYCLFVSLMLLELATASCHPVGSPVERPV